MSAATLLARRPDEADPTQLYVLAALRRRGAGYGFTIRWLLGASNDKDDQANDLPRLGDRFEVRLRRLSAGGGYLQADGVTWSANEHAFDVTPSPFAMLDPPRQVQDVPGTPTPGERQWLVATAPTGPVDPAVGAHGLATPTGSRAMGIVHLLDHTDRTVVAAKMAQGLRDAALRHDALRAAFADRAEHGRTAEAAAVYLTELAMQGRPNAYRIAQQVERDVALLEAGGPVRGLRSEASVQEAWRYASATAALSMDTALIDAALETRDEAERVRSQLRLRALQGGRMIDFWADGDAADPPLADRGRQHVAAHLFGLGLDVGQFSEADVRAWLALPHGSADAILFDVRHIPMALDDGRSPFDSGTDLPRLLLERTVRGYKNGSSLLKAGGIDAALSTGSSAPPPPPADAKVNYDLVRQWMDTEALSKDLDVGTGASKGYATGDGRLEVLIKPGAAADSSVMGFNVYGVWEGASAATDKWFAGKEPKSLDDLKPWLITRRYSHVRDLKGALPDIAGQPHKNLVAEHADPAWHPAQMRTRSVEDRTKESMTTAAETSRPLPYELNAGYASWGCDLRQGMGNGADVLRRGWDPAAPTKTDWTPYHWRFDDTAQASARAAPQRYRFWVTAVDGLDQESAPVRVATADRDCGEAETYIFAPRHRTPLPPPPQGEGEDVSIALAADRRQITVGFGVPRVFHLGGQEVVGVPPAKIAPQTLVANVMLLRRRLVRRVDTDVRTLASLPTNDPLFDTAPWSAALGGLEAQGWTRWRAARATPSADGAPVQVAFPLDHLARGFEYRAVVGFSIADAYLPFWQKPARKRTVQGTIKTATGFEPAPPAFEPEAPSVGAVGQTQPLPVPNMAPPRSAVALAPAIAWAKPVLPPPGIDRDLVLMRLLVNPIKADEATAPPDLADWLAQGLSLGQAHMAHAAMLRLDLSATGEPSQAAWQVVRNIVAHDLKAAGHEIQRHALVGFRGLAALSWTYTPLATQPPPAPPNPSQDSEAETTLFRVFAARAPRGDPSLSGGALDLRVLRRTATDLILEPTEVEPGLAGLLTSGRQPTLLRVAFDTGVVAFATGLAFSGPSPTKIDRLRLQFANPPTLPPQATAGRCRVYLGAPVVDVQNEAFEARSTQHCFVPVGGGPEEVGAWWIASVSAQEVAAPLAAWPSLVANLPATTKPAAPAAPRVRSVRRSQEAALLSNTAQMWRPQKLKDAAAPFEARLFASWDPLAFAAGALVEIDREFRRVGETKRARQFMARVEEWKALKAIEAAREGEALEPDWVALAARNWLLGRVIEPDPESPAPAEPYVSARTRPLDPAQGLAMIEADAGGGPLPSLVDYFAHDAQSLMESDYEYRYRVRVAQLADPGAPAEWRYLRSEWSAFSPWVVPVRPELLVTTPAATFAGHGVEPPTVVFQFLVKTAGLGVTRYRALLQRQVRAAFLSTPDDPTDDGVAWRDVGAIVDLPANPGGEASLIDDDLERSSLTEPMTIHYRLRVVHYAPGEDGETERLLRKAPGEPVAITVVAPPPAGTPLQDWTLVQRVSFE